MGVSVQGSFVSCQVDGFFGGVEAVDSAPREVLREFAVRKAATAAKVRDNCAIARKEHAEGNGTK